MTINNIHTQAPREVHVAGNQNPAEHHQQEAQSSQGSVTSLAREGQTLSPPQGLTQGESSPPPRTRHQSLRDLVANLNPARLFSSRGAEAPTRTEMPVIPMLTGMNRHSERFQFDPSSGLAHDLSADSFRSDVFPQQGSFSSRFESLLRHGASQRFDSGHLSSSSVQVEVGRQSDIEMGHLTDSGGYSGSSLVSGSSRRVRLGSNTDSIRSENAANTDRSRRPARLDTIQSMAEPQGMSLRELAAGLKPLAGPDGHFFFLTPEGKLHRFDPTVNEILSTGLSDVNKVVLGADRTAYAIQDGTLSRLGTNGSLSNPVPLELGNGAKLNVRDMAVSKTGSELFVLNGNDGLFVKDMTSTGPARHIAVPFDVVLSVPKSVATTSDNGLFIQGSNSEVWHARPSAGGGHDNLAWTNLGYPPQHITGLETLPDGTVAGRTADGRLLRPELQPNNPEQPAAWKEVPFDSLTKTAFEALHEALKNPSKSELITLGQSIVTVRPWDTSTLKQPWENLKDAVKGIPQKVSDLKNFNYANQQTHTLPFYESQVGMLKNQLDGLAVSLQGPVPDEVKQLVDGRLGADIGRRTEALLAMLPAEARGEASVSSEDGVLSRIRDVRKAVYGEGDHLVQQLTRAVQEGRTASVEAPPHGGKLAELITDYAILGTAAFRLTEGGQTTPEARQAVLDDAGRYLDQSLAHLVARSGIDKTDPFGRAAEGFDSLQAILRQPKDVITRLAGEKAAAAGETVSPNADMKDLTPVFEKVIDSMKPGDSISLGKGKNDGFNTETLRLVLSGAVKTMSGGLDDLVTWAIPIFDKGKLKDLELAIAKTDDGIALKVEQGESRYTQLGFRTGAGLVAIPEKMKERGVVWGFAGIEFAAKAKHTDKTADSITLNFKDQGNGNLPKLVKDIFSGQANLFELMRQSDKTDSTLTKESGWNVNTSGVLVGASGTDQPGWKHINEIGDTGVKRDNGPVVDAIGKLQSTGKALAAGVAEGAIDFSSKTTNSRTQSSTGEVSDARTRQDFGLNNMRVNGIGVSVLESDFVKFPLPGDMKLGPGESNPTLTGRAGLPGVLPGFIIGKTFEGFAPVSKSATMAYAEDGTAKGIDVRLTVNNVAKLFTEIDPSGELVQTVPGLKKALETLGQQEKANASVSSGPVRVGFALKPEVLTELSQDPAQRKTELEQLAQDPANFRITEFNVSYTNEAKQTRAVNFPGWTREVSGFVKTGTDSAKVEFLYDKADIIGKGMKLVDELSRFDDGAWGTTARQERLTGLMQQLENVVDALAQGPMNAHGEDLRRSVENDKNQVKGAFMTEVRAMLTSPVDAQKRSEILAKFEQLGSQIDALREKHHLPAFEGPAILTSGPVFIKTDVGRLTEDFRAGRHDEIPVENAMESLGRIARLDLSSLSGAKLDEAKLEVNKEMDAIKRTLNAMTDLDASWKEDFLTELNLFAARPDYQKGRHLQEKLNSL